MTSAAPRSFRQNRPPARTLSYTYCTESDSKPSSGSIALSNGSGSAQFFPIQLSNGAWVQVRALQFLNRTEDFHDLGVNWKEAPSSRHVSSKLQQHQLHAWLCFARTFLHECMPRPAGVRKFRLHACARRNIVGVQRHASLVTSTIGPVKITHCDQRKRHACICWHFEYSKSNELFERT